MVFYEDSHKRRKEERRKEREEKRRKSRREDRAGGERYNVVLALLMEKGKLMH